MKKFKFAIEMGGGYTCIYVKGQGLALKEPTLIAAEPTDEGYKVIAMGIDAKRLVAENPLQVFLLSSNGANPEVRILQRDFFMLHNEIFQLLRKGHL